MKKILILLTLLSVFLIGCKEEAAIQEAEPSEPESVLETLLEPIEETETVESPVVTVQETVQQETKTFNITAKQWDFSPSTISVNKGDKVVLNVTSIDVSHGIVIDGYNISEMLEPNSTVTLSFDADTAGTFSFFCSKYCGDGHSTMSGTLIVN